MINFRAVFVLALSLVIAVSGAASSQQAVASVAIQQVATSTPTRTATRVPIVIQLHPGDRLVIQCSGRLGGTVNQAVCNLAPTVTGSPVVTSTRQVTAEATPSATPSATATATVTPSPTATETPTSSPTATEHAHATPSAMATAVPAGAIFEPAPIAASILGTCTTAVHDRYVAQGPDGLTYRSWHPQVVPIDPANPAAGTCAFAHEHGGDPATSDIPGPEPIVFGYEIRVAQARGMTGMVEAHEGFKVQVANRGVVNDEDRASQLSVMTLFHMGTGGTRRYTAQHHTLLSQGVGPDGQRFLVRGMANTGLAGSICARDRTAEDGIPGNEVGRAVMTVRGVPETANGGVACVITSAYEIWSYGLDITRGRAGEDPLVTFTSLLAAFDPILTMDPRDLTRVLYTGDAFPPSVGAPFIKDFRGCDREFYTGSVIIRNPGTVQVWTDEMGRILTGSHTAVTALRQTLPVGNSFDRTSPAYAWQILSSRPGAGGDLNQFKLQTDFCVPGLGLRN